MSSKSLMQNSKQTEIMNTLLTKRYGYLIEQALAQQNEDLKQRQTKIVCTLGHHTKNVEPIKKMLKKGMNIARLNMNFFDVREQGAIINNIREACSKTGKDCAIMVDLKGPLIRTKGFKDRYSIKVVAG